ncbi:MAG: DUF86 domain-containing protein [Balneolales bacterium]|nr:DUF86 domain-containing protein [Balneolales bacterium]
MPHSVRKLLIYLSISCTEVIEFAEGDSFEEFQEDRILQLAVEIEFDIISEELNRLERLDADKLAERIPEYRRIIHFRNILAHRYDKVNIAAVWDFV